jgi:asparaginyl-tRNA synthetase
LYDEKNELQNCQVLQLKDLPQHVDETVEVLGTVRTLRGQKKWSFIELGYGEYQVQVILNPQLLGEASEGSYVKVTAKVQKLPPKCYSTMPVELSCSDLKVLGKSESDYRQICPPEAGPETKLEKRHFLFRDKRFALVTLTRAHLIQALRAHFADTECVEIVPPSFTGVECEGGVSLFKVEHPGTSSDKPIMSYLTQSSQFALELTLPGVGDCYCIAPSFRAEHSHTKRHLTEFLHAEAEWGGILKFDDHLDKLRHLLTGTLDHFIIVLIFESKRR